jgi:hypothetical protein
VAIDEQHVALPTLYGAPAYARPAPPIEETPRPLDADDLPIEAFRTSEEQELAQTLPVPIGAERTQAERTQPAAIPTVHPARAARSRPRLRPRPLSLRAMAGRLRGDS